MRKFLAKTICGAVIMALAILLGGPVWACWLGAIIFTELVIPSSD